MNGRIIERRLERLIAMGLIGFALALVMPHVRTTAWGSANTKSRIATVETLVHHGTFAIDQSPFHKTMDRIKIDGKLYSSKPPMLPTLIAGAYFVLHHTVGIDLRADRKRSAAHITLAVLVGGTALLLLMLFAYALLCTLTEDTSARLFGLAAVGFAEFGAGYAVDVNNHLPAAACGMGALYLAARIVKERSLAPEGGDVATPPWVFVAFGGAIGLLPTLDIPSALLSAALAVWVARTDPGRALKLALPAALVPVLLHFFLTYQYMGGFLPPQLRPDVWEKHGAGNTRDSWWVYSFNMLLGHHGVVAMVPLLIPSAVGVLRLVRRPPDAMRWARPLAGIIGGVAVTLFLFYSVRTKNYGGVCVGFRWLIPPIAWMMPMVGMFLATQSRPLHKAWRWGLPIMFAIGSSQMTSAASNPWNKSTWEGNLVEEWRRWTAEDKPSPDEARKRADEARKRREQLRAQQRAKARKRVRRPVAEPAGKLPPEGPVRSPSAGAPLQTPRPSPALKPARSPAAKPAQPAPEAQPAPAPPATNP